MQYLHVIKNSFIFFPFVALLFTLPYLLWNYHKYGSVFSFRIVVIYSMILYMMTVYFLCILPLPSRESVSQLTTPYMELRPFHFIESAIEEAHKMQDPYSLHSLIRNPALQQYVFNIAMLVPFGVYLHYYFKCSLFKTVFLSFLFSLFIELTQLSGLYFIYPRPYRLFEVDDLIANTLGGFVGYFFAYPFKLILPSRKNMDREALRRGQVVSALRRFTCGFLDFCVICICALMIERLNFTETWILYYAVNILFFKNRTIGMIICQMQITNKNGHPASSIESLVRYLILWVYLISLLLPFLHPAFYANIPDFYQKLLSIVEIVLFMQIIFEAAIHKQPFYGKLSGTWIKSTIGTNLVQDKAD